MSVSETFDLAVHVPADEWAYCQRRLAFLETLLLRLVHDHAEIPEWYDAAQLAAQQLPALPGSAQAIARRANAQGWLARKDGKRLVYHVVSLPPRAFDALLARILDLPMPHVEFEMRPEPPARPEPQPDTGDIAPPWVLPLVRLMKGEARGSLGAAWLRLPDHVPQGTILPTARQAAETLVRLGLA